MNAYDIAYTKLSLASNTPLNATEAFDDASGYRTEQQCAAISRAIQNDDQAALMAIMTELYALAILRNEGEQADKAEMDAADRMYDAWRDSLPAVLQVQVAL